MKQRLQAAYDYSIIVLGSIVCLAALYRLPVAALDLQFFILAAVVLCFTSRLVVTWAHVADSARYVTAVAVMGLTQYAGNAGLASMRSALRTGQSIWHTWKNGFLWTSVTYFAGASAAALIAPLVGRIGPYAF